MDSSTYSGQSETTKQGVKLDAANDFESANYALMIYDKNKYCFRLVPVNRQIHFERKKVSAVRKPFVRKLPEAPKFDLRA